MRQTCSRRANRDARSHWDLERKLLPSQAQRQKQVLRWMDAARELIQLQLLDSLVVSVHDRAAEGAAPVALEECAAA